MNNFSAIDYDEKTGTFKTNNLAKVSGSYEKEIAHTEGVISDFTTYHNMMYN